MHPPAKTHFESETHPDQGIETPKLDVANRNNTPKFTLSVIKFILSRPVSVGDKIGPGIDDANGVNAL